MNTSLFTIITFYQFKKISNIDDFKNDLKDFCKFNKIRGTVILAEEGINGTVAGSNNLINQLISFLKNRDFNKINLKYSYYKYMPFNRLKIRKKSEIVTFKSTHTDPENRTGKYVTAQNWNKFIDEKDVLLIDVRNNFEIKIGTFEGAVNPKTQSFTEFKKFIDKELNNKKNNKIAMFCTGGIRCEKASSYMIRKGFENVYQLKGGILKYLEIIPENNSKWNGECFVFDNRVSIKNDLKEGTYDLCHACRYPLSVKDRKSPQYKKGLSCAKCYGKLSKIKIKNLIERERQIDISKRKGIYNPYIKSTRADY